MLCIPSSMIQYIKIHVKTLLSGFKDGKKIWVFQEFENIHLWGKKKYDTYFIFLLALVARKREIFFSFSFACVQECSLVWMGVITLYWAPWRVCKPPLKSFSADAWGHFAWWICKKSCLLPSSLVLETNLQRKYFISDTWQHSFPFHPRNQYDLWSMTKRKTKELVEAIFPVWTQMESHLYMNIKNDYFSVMKYN